MLYHLLKPFVRLALFIICRKLVINKPELLLSPGPLLLAVNHPNSFLDSVVLNALFDQPVWSLARGDVFGNPAGDRLLAALRILPVFRLSEGSENLSANYNTFNRCMAIFRNKGVVQIFSEGRCVNEWHLRPLRKGTARLAIKAWEENIPLKVLPVAINYSSFRRFGKNIFIHFGTMIEPGDFRYTEPDGHIHLAFNKRLRQELEKGVWEINPADHRKLSGLLRVPPSPARQLALLVPAIAGFLIHAPLYFPLKLVTRWKAGRSDHYDSILVAMLFLSYPVYLAALTVLLIFITNTWWPAALLFLAPLSAWALVQLKPQLDPMKK